MTKPLCMKVENWPALDRERWEAAGKAGAFLRHSGLATNWSPSRRRIAEQAYGQWLAWLDRESLLNSEMPPQHHVTPERLNAFISELRGRVCSYSVAMMVGALKRMLDAIAPETDWSWLRPVCANLKRNARPSRNRLAHMVEPRQLFDLGLSMMEDAKRDQSGHPMRVAARARDGLMIAMLICCPIRMANLLQIEVGVHLLHDGDRYRLHFGKDETKTRKEFDGDLPPILTPYVEWYLQEHRAVLLALGEEHSTRRLWIDRWGTPMSEPAIRAQIKFHTGNAFGRSIWPHLFRGIAVTGVVDEAPEQVGITSDLLGHSNFQTTAKHYVLASATRAHQRVQSSFLQARKEALERLRNRPTGSDKMERPTVRHRIRIVRKGGNHG